MKNKIIGITGATSGIGLEIKKQLEGNNTVINFSRTNGFDLSDNKKVNEVIDIIKNNGVDVLILNSGVYESGEFSSISFNRIDEIISVNLLSNIKIISRLKNEIIKGLKIIITLSMASFINGVDEAVYNVSKKGLKEYLIAVETELKYHLDTENPFFYFVPGKIEGTKMTSNKNVPTNELSTIVAEMLTSFDDGDKEYIQKRGTMKKVFSEYVNDPISQGMASIEYRKANK